MTGSVCIDLDGVLARECRPFRPDVIGEPVAGAADFTRRIRTAGFRVVIHTCRATPIAGRSSRIGTIREWLAKHRIGFDEVWAGEGKPHADAYVDDKAVACRPQHDRDAFDRALERVGQLTKRRRGRR